MKLKLIRKWFTENSTIGELFIDDKFECFTLEDTVRENPFKPVSEWKIKGKTAIPIGSYPVVVDRSARFKVDMPHLLNVEGFTGIRIHWGNTDQDTDGCILVGETMGKDFIGSSKKAYNRVIKKLIDAGDNIMIEIHHMENIKPELKEEVSEVMAEKKNILKSKTTWTCIGGIGFGIYLIVSGEVDSGIQTVLAGFAGIFMRSGVNKV